MSGQTMNAVPNTLLAAEKVEKRFGGVVAVDGIDLAIAENEFFALLGPSGCGKTTLLRMIAGFETPTAGRLTLDGRRVTGNAFLVRTRERMAVFRGIGDLDGVAADELH